MSRPPAGEGDQPQGDEADAGQPPHRDLDPVQRTLLAHATRRAVFETVARTPGLNKHQVATRADVGHKVADHHLERLEAYDLIELFDGPREGEVVCFHADDASLWEDEATRILYGRAPCRRIALYIWANPGCTTDDLCQALDKRPRTIQEHLSALRERGLVRRLWWDRRAEYHPTERLEAWANAVGDRYPDPENASRK